MKKTEIILAVCLLAAYPVNAYAYLDPGTGSYVLQIIIAGALSVAFGVKMFWRSIKSKISGLFGKDK